ncbi:MAG: hypothetical protein JNK30_13735 [Phenylobacterium sp.]|uniref:hypothetical protein n=1 Tax=Phenylobacterium sp. TaxID=1871053 RepID=UPI001A3AF5B0|nr:hypothetical protein [Phenylobacterium sp.]MBL8772438.1 hypothetical protein [Phenylobacterium sp.]
MTLRASILALAMGGLWAPAAAQPSSAADPIGEILGQRAIEPEEPRAPAPRLTRPVMLHETGRSPDAPPSPADVAYDSRLKSSAASAQGFQGRLEGAWTLSAGGREAYAVQLVDRNGSVEGAWRDLRRPGALDGSGYIEAVERAGEDVILRLPGGTVATLRPQGDRYSGELTERGRTEPATLARRTP